MSKEQILDGVRTVLREKLEVRHAIEPHTDLFADLELDSLQQLTMVVELENHFRVCFDPGEEVGITTVSDVVTVVRHCMEREDHVQA